MSLKLSMLSVFIALPVIIFGSDEMTVLKHWDDARHGHFKGKFVAFEPEVIGYFSESEAYYCGEASLVFAYMSRSVERYESRMPKSWDLDTYLEHMDHEVPELHSLVKKDSAHSVMALTCGQLFDAELKMRLANKGEISAALKAITEGRAEFTYNRVSLSKLRAAAK